MDCETLKKRIMSVLSEYIASSDKIAKIREILNEVQNDEWMPSDIMSRATENDATEVAASPSDL